MSLYHPQKLHRVTPTPCLRVQKHRSILLFLFGEPIHFTSFLLNNVRSLVKLDCRMNASSITFLCTLYWSWGRSTFLIQLTFVRYYLATLVSKKAMQSLVILFLYFRNVFSTSETLLCDRGSITWTEIMRYLLFDWCVLPRWDLWEIPTNIIVLKNSVVYVVWEVCLFGLKTFSLRLRLMFVFLFALRSFNL